MKEEEINALSNNALLLKYKFDLDYVQDIIDCLDDCNIFRKLVNKSSNETITIEFIKDKTYYLIELFSDRSVVYLKRDKSGNIFTYDFKIDELKKQLIKEFSSSIYIPPPPPKPEMLSIHIVKEQDEGKQYSNGIEVWVESADATPLFYALLIFIVITVVFYSGYYVGRGN